MRGSGRGFFNANGRNHPLRPAFAFRETVP